jgi:hypothetical protein
MAVLIVRTVVPIGWSASMFESIERRFHAETIAGESTVIAL